MKVAFKADLIIELNLPDDFEYNKKSFANGFATIIERLITAELDQLNKINDPYVFIGDPIAIYERSVNTCQTTKD